MRMVRNCCVSRCDWYSRDEWETALDSGTNSLENFYQNGIKDRRYGGDLQGVLDKLDYLAGLGVNALYFCPLFSHSGTTL